MADKVLVTPRSFGKEEPALFDRLAQAGFEVVRNDTGTILTKGQMIEKIAPCAGVIVGVDPLDAEVIAAAPRLRAIAKYGVGVDNIDLTRPGRGASASPARWAPTPPGWRLRDGADAGAFEEALTIDRRCRAGDWSKIVTSDVTGATCGASRPRRDRKAGGEARAGLTCASWPTTWPGTSSTPAPAPRYAQVPRILREGLRQPAHAAVPSTENFIGEASSPDEARAILINTPRRFGGRGGALSA